tara:strand:- start:1521 stop:2573 length:1053 start_codon:yes stop_codon:yes gene_type:complete
MKFFLYALTIFVFSNPVASAAESECKYKKEFIDADLRCKGDGDCMFPRFEGLTSYEGDFNDYMDCVDWKTRKIIENNKDESTSSKEGEFYVNRGIERLDSGDREGAMSDFSEAINLQYMLFVNYRNRAVVKSQLNDYKGAILDLSKSIDIKPSAQSYILRGKIKRRLGDVYGACYDWEDAVQKRLFGIYFWERSELYSYCMNLYAGGEWSSGIGRFVDGNINQRWKNFNTYNNNGIRKLKAADYAGALTQFLKAKELYPRDPRVNSNIGDVKIKLKDYSGAISSYNKAIEIFPTNPYYWFDRSSLKKETGDIKGSCNDYNKAISLADKELRDIFLRSDSKKYCNLQPKGT